MQFPLFPMDETRESAPAARAHAVSHDGKWLLRAFNGWVWAREAHNPQPERTWVLPVELPAELDAPHPNAGSSLEYPAPDAALLADWFALGDVSDLWRAVWFYDEERSDRPYTLFFSPDGEGILREAWNRDNIPFHWAAPSGASAKRVREGLFAEFRSLAYKLFYADLWDKLGDWGYFLKIEMHFLGGSQAELNRVLQLIVWNDPLLSKSRQAVWMRIVPESAFSRAQLKILTASDVSCRFVNDPEKRGAHGHSSWRIGNNRFPRFAIIEELVDLALDANTPCGLNWEYSDDYAGRQSSRPNAAFFDFEFKSEFEALTKHEQLEAYLELRAWLEQRVPKSDVERLLSP